MFKFRRVIKTCLRVSRVEFMKNKFMASLIGGVLLIGCAAQVAFAQQPTCSRCGEGLEVACTDGHLSGGDSCYMVGSMCFLNNPDGCHGDLSMNRNCQPDLNSAVHIQLDTATIENLVASNPQHALVLAAIVGGKQALYDGIIVRARWTPQETSADQLKYWLNPNLEGSKSYFSQYRKKSNKLASIGQPPVELDIMLTGNDLTLTIVSESKLSQGKSLKLSLGNENIIKHTDSITTNLAQGQKK